MRFHWSGKEDRNREMIRLLTKFSTKPAAVDPQLRQDVADIFEFVVLLQPMSRFSYTIDHEASRQVMNCLFRAASQLDRKDVFERGLAIALESASSLGEVEKMLQRHGFAWL